MQISTNQGFMTKDKKKIITSHQTHAKDTWSAEVQIAIITERINSLTEHLKTHKKDVHSRLWLVKLAWKRKKLLDYLKRKSPEKYQELTKKLKIRVATTDKK